jgi:hypothetical protein
VWIGRERGWYHLAVGAPRAVARLEEARMADPDRKERAQEKPKEELKVTDRRHFTSSGELRTEILEEHGDEERHEPARTEERAPEVGRSPSGGFERRPLDEPEGVDFTMLINAMAQPALLFLGEIPHPATGKPTFDLEQARLQIDMLDLLRVKSRGNLTPQEEGLLDRVLYQLRMLYVARTEKPR